MEKKKNLGREYQEGEKQLKVLKIFANTALAGLAGAAAYQAHRLLNSADVPISGDALDQFTDPNQPVATVPAEPATGRPDVDMDRIKQAVDDAKGKPDGTSGASKTTMKPMKQQATGSNAAPSFVEKLEVPQETPEQKAKREAAYIKAVNDGLKVERTAEQIAADKAIAEKFAQMFSQDPQYKDIASADIESAVLNGYYKTVEQLVAEENIIGLKRLSKGERATAEEVAVYFAGLKNDPARLAAYQDQVRSARDTGGMYGMNSMGEITGNLANSPRQGGRGR